MFLCLCKASLKDTLFLQGTDSLGAEVHRDLFAIYDEGLLLNVRSPDVVCAALRIADSLAVLVAFTGDFACCCHKFSLVTSIHTTVFLC